MVEKYFGKDSCCSTNLARHSLSWPWSHP